MAKPCIVCVDDEPLALEAVAAALEHRFGEKYDVLSFESGADALLGMEELRRGARDIPLVLADQEMPGIKGDVLLSLVHRGFPRTLKVLLTSDDGIEAVLRATNSAGLSKYIEKPWEPEALFLTVASLLTQYELTVELERKTSHLEALHQVGLALASSFDIGFILQEMARAASLFMRPAGVDVFYAGSRSANALPRWYPEKPSLTAQERARLEREIAARWSEHQPAPWSLELMSRAVVPIEHDRQILGLIVVDTPPRALDEATRGLLHVLSLQAATALDNIHLTQERIHFERLSAVGRMIGSLVHDLRGPLTAARGYASLLAGPNVTDDHRKQYARLLHEECDRLSEMTEELLEFTRSGSARLSRRWVQTADYVKDLARDLEKLFSGCAVRVETHLGYDGPLYLDPLKLTRAVLNVATNARQAMAGKGLFEIRVARREGSVALSFRDTGCGIPPSIAHRIFEPFFTHGKAQGIGLGASNAKKIVEDHGGEIVLESEEGRGTTVEFRLPLEPQVETGRTRDAAAFSPAERV